MAPTAPDADVILNRVNLALAKSERLLASWLPPKANNTSNASSSAISREAGPHDKLQQKKDTEEDDLFTAEPELLGLGAKESPSSTYTIATNDRLRKHLLGRRHNASQTQSRHAQPGQHSLNKASPSRGAPRALSNGSSGLSHKRNGGSSIEAGEDGSEEESRTTIPRARPTKKLKPNETSHSKKKKEKEQSTEKSKPDIQNSTTVYDQGINSDSPLPFSPPTSISQQPQPARAQVTPSPAQEHQPDIPSSQQHPSLPAPLPSGPVPPVPSGVIPIGANPSGTTTKVASPKPGAASSPPNRPPKDSAANQRERRRRKKQRARQRKQEREREQ